MHAEDLWLKPDATGKKVKTERWGKGKRWRASWTEPDGTRRSRSCMTKDEASAILADVKVAQLSGAYIAPDRSKVTVRDVAEEWFAAQVHQRSSSLAVIRQRLDGSILPALGHLRPEAFDLGRAVGDERSRLIDEVLYQVARQRVRRLSGR